MKLFLLSFLFSFSFFLIAEKDIPKVGDEFSVSSGWKLPLYHYKKDVLKLEIGRDIFYSIWDFRSFTAVDVRDIYYLKRGDRIKLTESYKEGKFFKVQLIKESPTRSYYFVEGNKLKNLTLINRNHIQG